MPYNLTPTREEWRTKRDAAGLKQGFTDKSIGDLWDAYLTETGQKNALNKSIMKFLGSIDPKTRGKAAAAAAIKFWAAAADYRQKMKDKQYLKTVVEDGHEWDEGSPEVLAVARYLERMMDITLKTIMKCHAEGDLIKAHHHALKAVEVARGGVQQDTIPKREEWQKHRDSAGLPQHYVTLSVGGAIETLRTRLKNPRGSVTAALEELEPAEMDACLDAAIAAAAASVQYQAKLQKEDKHTKPTMKPVIFDLQRLFRTSQEIAGHVGVPALARMLTACRDAKAAVH